MQIIFGGLQGLYFLDTHDYTLLNTSKSTSKSGGVAELANAFLFHPTDPGSNLGSHF
jgi:hypothetical protein